MDKIKSVFKSYQPIVTYFTEERITQRYHNIYNCYIKFIDKKKYYRSVKINEFSLMHAIMDYFTDIYRLKMMHEIKNANEYKIIGYSTYWLMRRKPLEVVDIDNEELVFVNELFGASYFYTELIKDLPKGYYKDLPKQIHDALSGYAESLFYYLKYRTYTAQDLEMCALSFYSALLIGNMGTDKKLNDSYFEKIKLNL